MAVPRDGPQVAPVGGRPVDRRGGGGDTRARVGRPAADRPVHHVVRGDPRGRLQQVGRATPAVLRHHPDHRLSTAQPGWLAHHRDAARWARVHLPDWLRGSPGRYAVPHPGHREMCSHTAGQRVLVLLARRPGAEHLGLQPTRRDELQAQARQRRPVDLRGHRHRRHPGAAPVQSGQRPSPQQQTDRHRHHGSATRRTHPGSARQRKSIGRWQPTGRWQSAAQATLASATLRPASRRRQRRRRSR